MDDSALHHISGLDIGQSWDDVPDGTVLRIVAVDPDLDFVEAEDASGVLVVDSIRHFLATHYEHLCALFS